MQQIRIERVSVKPTSSSLLQAVCDVSEHRHQRMLAIRGVVASQHNSCCLQNDILQCCSALTAAQQEHILAMLVYDQANAE
jgi:hypothetical protein